MNATKRKFNALIQGLGNPPPPAGQTDTLARTMDYEALLQKRRRLGFPDSTAPRPDAPSTRIAGLASPSHRRPGKPADGGDDSSLARYSPNSRDDLLKRLATFQEITEWTPKPDEINEVEWARRGWVCRGKERVRCLLCHKELVVKLKKDEADGNDMDELAAAEFVLEDLKQRYQDLCTRQTFLPFFAEDKAPQESPPNKPALALALLGWQGLVHPRIGAVPNSASCHTCLRRLGLWMFKSKEVDEQGQVIVPSPMDHLDPIREHRFFCPWKNAGAQSRRSEFRGDMDEPAWLLLLKSIKNDSDLRGVYEGRTKTPSKAARKQGSMPSTPVRGQGARSLASATPRSVDHAMTGSAEDGPEEDEAARNAKDKERWARLRKVRSLFDTKKLRRPMTIRPGTSVSNKSLPTAKE
ncbi:mRNA export factor rsm1 [Escovopsis weberi]|uniref:mRNA export factor rsm1 n=1 Tax=Escovopsis weberi TaxID=150374 RepID=A0A0M8MZH2_ESCWE|nr:mRNA export factor rsm1 [Escovopsis weberi]